MGLFGLSRSVEHFSITTVFCKSSGLNCSCGTGQHLSENCTHVDSSYAGTCYGQAYDRVRSYERERERERETDREIILQQDSVLPDNTELSLCGIVVWVVRGLRKAESCKFYNTRVTHVIIALRLHFIAQVMKSAPRPMLSDAFLNLFSVSAPRNLFRRYFLLLSSWSRK